MTSVPMMARKTQLFNPLEENREKKRNGDVGDRGINKWLKLDSEGNKIGHVAFIKLSKKGPVLPKVEKNILEIIKELRKEYSSEETQKRIDREEKEKIWRAQARERRRQMDKRREEEREKQKKQERDQMIKRQEDLKIQFDNEERKKMELETKKERLGLMILQLESVIEFEKEKVMQKGRKIEKAPSKLAFIAEKKTWICPLCKEIENGLTIQCDMCQIWHHTSCLKLIAIPPAEIDWYCPPCNKKSLLPHKLAKKK